MTQRLKPLYFLALILPTLFLASQILINLQHRATAPTYNVIVEGYDPRDLVYGEYLQFRFMWNDPRSQKPEGATDLPETGRVYLPESNARDLQTMLWERKNTFTATVSLMGKKPLIRSFTIDGKPWQEGLAAWRQNHK